MPLRTEAEKKVSHYILLIAILLISGIAGSLSMNILKIEKNYKEIAKITGKSFFQSIVATRSWNSSLGGVYATVSKNAVPNPYLKDLLRDVVTTDGIKLTMINPAYMTRMISELLVRKNQIRFRISSLRPLNPENAPTAWERGALEQFQSGKEEIFDVVEREDGETFQYMGVLKVGKGCLKCHGGQGYAEGDVRGGISVSFSYAPFRNAINNSKNSMLIGHVLFLLFGLLVITLMGKRLIRSIGELEAARVHVRRLEGLLPICANCKKMRIEGADPMDEGSWVVFEKYLSDRSDVKFSHGLCPECARQLYPDIFKQ